MFQVVKEDRKTKARMGILQTAHGKVETPVFMPVGTKATVKTLTPQDLFDLGVEIVLANTYHLYFQPGDRLIRKLGGIHNFMGWNKPVLTDSGGFQVFSLRQRTPSGGVVDNREDEQDRHLCLKVSERGCVFRDPRNGTKHIFTPEKAIEVQKNIGADIIMAFDECTPYPCSWDEAKQSMEITHKWAKRSLAKFRKKNKKKVAIKQLLFGIIQGSIYQDLRQQSSRFIVSLPFDGIAVGGVSVGESKKEMYQVLDWVEPFLPKNKPRYVMGIGAPEDLLEAIDRGYDMFDCVLPTRLARNGAVWIKDDETKQGKKINGRVDLTKSIFREDAKPIMENCSCYACKNFSRAYIHHLLRSKEILGIRLTTIHNLHFVLELARKSRQAIRKDCFSQFKAEWLKDWEIMK